MAAGDGLRAAAKAIVGGALRAVAAYDERDYELEYIRDDVGRRYSAGELEAVFEELALSGRDRDASRASSTPAASSARSSASRTPSCSTS